LPSLDEIAAEADERAQELEEDFRRLALTLFAFELAMMVGAIGRSRTDAAVIRSLRTAVNAYRSPTGIFRQRWENEFADLLFRSASDHARFDLPVVQGQAPTAPAIPAELRRSIETRAEEIAANVNDVTASKIEAAASAIANESADRRDPPGPQDPPAPPTGPDEFDQRLETLAPLIGRKAAEEVMAIIRAGREKGLSISKVAQNLVEHVHSIEVNRKRAQTIARTETIGLVNMTEHERAVATGVLNEKRWVSQRDDRVRESHQRCEAEGWILIEQRYSNGLMYPGERPAPAEEVVGCRCSQAFRFNPNAKAASPAPSSPRITAREPEAEQPSTPQQGRTVLEGGEIDTLAENTVNGQLTPERQAVHDAIVDEYFSKPGVAPVENPKSFMTGGGGASGKSTMIAKMELPENLLKIDVDEIRTKLPEWKAEQAAARAAGRQPHEMMAAYTHEESSFIKERIVQRAVAERYNLLLDGVGGGGITKLIPKVSVLRASGAPVIADYVTVDYDTALGRMRKRGERTGRYVPESTLRAQHLGEKGVSRTFYDAIQQGLFDEFTLWDNSGDGPVVVATGRGSQVIVHNKDLWEQFLQRAGIQ
jgi:predicted ABC-type ATPase